MQDGLDKLEPYSAEAETSSDDESDEASDPPNSLADSSEIESQFAPRSDGNSAADSGNNEASTTPPALYLRRVTAPTRWEATVLTQTHADPIRLKEENRANRVRYDELRDEIIGLTDSNLTPTQVLAKMEELSRVAVDQLR
ncbi:hypothetical protein FPCIR_12529, partial [Fusarium pseudocircinatum]